jgi:hypothetical protein
MEGKVMRISTFACTAFLAAQVASASTTSITGSFLTPEDTYAATVTLTSAGVLNLQTWGFGGGTNAASQVISAGGFDSFVGVFAGTGDNAVFVDGTSDILSNYGLGGCPPAGTVNIGGAVCGDVALSETLAAGTYTVLLSDAAYIPYAVFETGGLLGDGFADLTGGVFQTCSGTNCITPTANWALDITTPNDTTPVPEPGGFWIFGFTLIAWGMASRRRLTRLPFPKLNN